MLRNKGIAAPVFLQMGRQILLDVLSHSAFDMRRNVCLPVLRRR
jgi:hypothetical protein